MLTKKKFTIHRKEKDGDWYIYLQCFEHENSKRTCKNTKSFKLDKSNAVSVGTTAIKPYLSICQKGLFQKPHRTVKHEKCETFYVSKRLVLGKNRVTVGCSSNVVS